MSKKVLLILAFTQLFWGLHSQSSREESFRVSYKSDFKSVEARLVRDENNPKLLYQYADLCYKLCKYRDAEKALSKITSSYKDSAQYYLLVYHTAKALKNKEKANEYFYEYKRLSTSVIKDNKITYKELDAVCYPALFNPDLTLADYFPYLLKNEKVKHLTKTKYTYSEPSNALLFKNYLTDEFVFTDDELSHTKKITQPDRGEGFSYSNFCLNKAQDKIYMTRYDGVNQRMLICYSEKLEEKWTQFKTLVFVNKNSRYNFLHPMLSPNEDQLIFSSDMKGSVGGYDLWIADINQANEIENVQNLGSKINTAGNECYPTLHNNLSFFFSSDGHPGYGALDIYRCDFDNNRLSEPINLGSGINSARDDYGLFFDDKKEVALFTSNRSIGYANLFFDKIYKVNINLFQKNILTLEIRNPFVNVSEAIALSKNILNNENMAISSEEPAISEEKLSASAIGNPNENISEELYKIANEKIEEKFIAPKEDIIREAVSNKIVENKFWTTAKLIFKGLEMPISYTYCRVIDAKNEVVYSNYSGEKGTINIEVIESNEYTIEIPRYRTVLKNYVFSKDGNLLQFDYAMSVPIQASPSNNPPLAVKRNYSQKYTKIKPLSGKNNSVTTKSNSNKTLASTTKKSVKPISKIVAKSKKSEATTTTPPRNILQNFN